MPVTDDDLFADEQDDRPLNIEMTDRQLAGTVRFGRAVTVTCPELSEVPLTGYVSGFDDDNIFLVCPSGDVPPLAKWLVGREYVVGIQLHDKRTIWREPAPLRRKLEEITHPFRRFVLDRYFGERPGVP